MVSIRRLEINGIRNLRDVKLENCRRINILFGENGSGKTSVLEAIHLLGMGRSFRGNRLASVINYQMNDCAVFGELQPVNDTAVLSLGIKRTKSGRYEIRMNKQPITAVSVLAQTLPLQLINTEAFELIEGGAKIRRQFMDWGLFHVKPDFLELWRGAQRCLQQRNHLLKMHKVQQRTREYSSEIAAWDRELAEFSAEIDLLRRQYVEDIKPFFYEILRHFVRLPDLSINYQRGWGDEALQTLLRVGFAHDLVTGTTAVGPHRANIDIRSRDLAVADTLSRGQLKLIVTSLKLAQGKLLAAQRGWGCVYLIDDLSAELDMEHRSALCKLLDDMGNQVFITGAEMSAIKSDWQDINAVQQFHVKHGTIEQVNIGL